MAGQADPVKRRCVAAAWKAADVLDLPAWIALERIMRTYIDAGAVIRNPVFDGSRLDQCARDRIEARFLGGRAMLLISLRQRLERADLAAAERVRIRGRIRLVLQSLRRYLDTFDQAVVGSHSKPF